MKIINFNIILLCILLPNFASLQPAECGGGTDSARASAASPERTAEQKALDDRLINAAYEGDLDGAQKYLSEGADINATDGQGQTALMKAANIMSGRRMGANAKENLVKLFLATPNVDVNAQDKHGWTALAMAADKHNTDIVRSLLEAKANVNTQNDIGWTALKHAGFEGYADIVELLLKAGADPSIRDKNDKDFLYHANQAPTPEAVAAVKKAYNDYYKVVVAAELANENINLPKEIQEIIKGYAIQQSQVSQATKSKPDEQPKGGGA